VNSVRAVNRRLSDEWGNPMIFIERMKCKNLVLDLSQVVWEESGSSNTAQRVKKVRNKLDPYFYRSHASDALCGLVHREWPTHSGLIQAEDKKDKDEEERLKKKKGSMKKKQKPNLRAAFPD